jgi:glycosyltransferase involved in cell wall biosynthesis
LPPLLSIIIPAHNEEARLPKSLSQVMAYLEQQTYESEVIVVENGSRDRTAQVALDFAARHPTLHVIQEARAGKGLAVRTGMLKAKGEYRFICDADLSMPIGEVARFLPPQLASYDIAIGSREAPGAVRYGEPFHRHWIGRIFNLLVRILAIPGISDTQCGFKSFSAQASQELFRLQKLDGWTFDVEVLFLARRRGYKIIEVPIEWHYYPSSRIRVLRDSWHMLLDLFRIRINWMKGRYAQ